MQLILCTQCQSQNPHYTKFCLTCGSTITPPAKREASAQTAQSPQSPQSSAKTEEKAAAPPTQEQGNSGWLSGLKRLWIF